MFFIDSQEPDVNFFLDGDPTDPIHPPSPPPLTCSQGHRSTLSLRTREGGTICLLCFSNLVSDPYSPTLHVSYALSQLSQALSDPLFLRSLLSSHANFLVSPLVHALSSFEDDPIANQIVDVITVLCSHEGSSSICGDFVGRVSDQLSSGALAWSRRQLYLLHCFGVLISSQNVDLCAHIKDKGSVICILVLGLQLPSEDIRGEIFYALYKLASLQNMHEDGDGAHILPSFCPKLLYLSLEALAKTEMDDVRLNCLALLTILAQKGLFANPHANNFSSIISGDSDGPTTRIEETAIEGSRLSILFAEAIKGPLLSTDRQVQSGTLDLIFHYLSQWSCPTKQIQVLVEENIADYAFEILRLSECNDPLVNSCLRVLDLFSLAEKAFGQRLVVGFPSVVQVLRYVSEVPFHPFQIQTLNLIRNCVCDCPGVASSSHVKEIVPVMMRMLENYSSQEMGLLPDAFTIICSIFVALLRTPSFTWTPDLVKSVQASIKHAILACLSFFEKDSNEILHGLYLLKEVYVYCCELSSMDNATLTELSQSVIDVCRSHLLPWCLTAIREMNEDTILGVMETFNIILLQKSDIPVVDFAKFLVAAAWFSFSFGCLGYFSTEKTKQRVYLMLSSLVDVLLGDMGESIRDAATCLPSDPIDLLFLLGQDSSNNSELSCCQSAILLILYTSSLYNDRIADDKLVLASLEQYILLNSINFVSRWSDHLVMMQLVSLYGLYRALQKESFQIPYSPEVQSIIFHLLNENDWDLQSAEIHFASLKWLFQQERLFKGLSYQLLKFCRDNSLNGDREHIYGESSQRLDIYRITELVSDVDNYGATLLVCLLIQLAEKEEQQNDIILVLNLMTSIICIGPAASDQLCFQGVGSAIQTLLCTSIHTSSEHILIAVLPLMFNILISVHPEALANDESWVSVTLLNNLTMREAVNKWNRDGPLVIGIFCLLLRLSSDGSLTEVSKNIVFNCYLVSTVDSAVDAACSKGLALTEYYEGTNLGDNLIFMLLLYFFSLRSLHYVLPEGVDWKAFFDTSDKEQALRVIKIRCHNLCRLIHFGPPLIKLVASYCLVELFSGLSEHIEVKKEKLKFSVGYLTSVVALLQGLMFYDDIQVAMNCALCLSIILGWKDLEMDQEKVIAKNKNNWCRLIVEELSMSLAVPCAASNSFINHHKPAVYVTVALLKLQNRPDWLRTVFDDSCISCIIGNLRTANISAEIVLLFRELVNSEFLNAEQVSGLNRVFQACRKQMYSDDPQNDTIEAHIKKTIASGDDQAEICEILLRLMMSEPFPYTNFKRSESSRRRLFDEIDLFFKALTVENSNSYN